TSKLRITIISQEDLAARVTDELRAVKTQGALVRQTQQRTKQETAELGDEVKDKPQLDSADKAAADRLTQQQSSAASSAKLLAGRMKSSLDRLEENRSEANDLKDIAANVKETLERTSEGAMKDASQSLSSVSQSPGPQPRSENLAKAQTEQQKALDELDAAMAKMDNIGSLASTIAELNNILSEQRELRKENEALSKSNLGKKPEQMAETDRNKLNATADKQENLADRTEKAVGNIEKQSKQMEKSDPSGSDAMKAAAAKAQESKVQPNQKRAGQQTRQNQQATAQEAQQQVELGLETMLSELKEAQRRELARLREELAKLQEQIATLVRRQAGHNLDNVLLQGPEKLKSLDQKQLADLTSQSQRKPEQLKAPEARQLSSGQELTERNTRDLGKTADAQPPTAEVGAQLTKAAGKMERAIVSLRAGKLAEALDPSQIDALAALLEAQKQIDEQKKEADEKEKNQQKDAIRQRYEKIKEQQEKLNVETTRVDKSRDEAGNIKRLEWPTIGRLPKEQLGLAEQTAAIQEDLETLGSVVYVWANQDIKNSMEGVRADLEASKTGVPTQAEQARVVEQLDAMIKQLSQKPPEQKFEQQANPGAAEGEGAGKPPKMPPAAELQLLKALQEAVNRSTVRIDAEKVKDEPKIAALGNRQGEMRNLLDTLLKKTTGGKMELGAEPDNKDQLPEEATAEDMDEKELEGLLLEENPTQEKIDQDFKLVGTRMARSRQRLAINTDPGKVTQTIQDRILKDLDALIEMAEKNQQQQQQQQQQQAGKPQQPQPQPQPQEAANKGENKAGEQQESKQDAGEAKANSSGVSKPSEKDIRENASEWGALTPRVRDAVIEAKDEEIVQQYQKLIEDYYEALARQGGRTP
ncbi:MAG TPA: hypothetical protein VGB55_02245, partial [Tepidisphaeraceae bacterium]